MLCQLQFNIEEFFQLAIPKETSEAKPSEKSNSSNFGEPKKKASWQPEGKFRDISFDK